MISAQNGHGMQFPKGGWEIDESMEQAALRETLEEAGVVGNVEVSIYNHCLFRLRFLAICEPWFLTLFALDFFAECTW